MGLAGTGSDFGEYFKVHRINGVLEYNLLPGMVVAIIPGTKYIKLAEEGDAIIVSGICTVIGNSAKLYWNKKYVRTVFGKPILQSVGYWK